MDASATNRVPPPDFDELLRDVPTPARCATTLDERDFIIGPNPSRYHARRYLLDVLFRVLREKHPIHPATIVIGDLLKPRVDRAVADPQRAHDVLDAWMHLPVEERRDLMNGWAADLEDFPTARGLLMEMTELQPCPVLEIDASGIGAHTCVLSADIVDVHVTIQCGTPMEKAIADLEQIVRLLKAHGPEYLLREHFSTSEIINEQG